MMMRCWLCIAALAGVAAADDEDSTDSPRYETRVLHDPSGIGKFYMGREIAHVMGHQGADWLDRPERVDEEKPADLLEALQLKPGMNVADIGAGTGYITFPMAKQVAPDGKVFAVDIQQEMLDILAERMKKLDVPNIEPVKGEIDDPKLPDNTIDLIIMVDVYHEFEFPWEMTVAMVRSLRPGGRIVFVEYRLEDPAVPIKLVHKMSQKQVLKEMEPHPLRWVGTVGTLPRQHIIIFEKSEPSETTKP
jgi:ubiquinone/menaquinone biosynthesis C-methylase UbiE